jgi:hypothetical protein
MSNSRSATTSVLALVATPPVAKSKPAEGIRVVRDPKLARAIRSCHAAIEDHGKAVDAERAAQERAGRLEVLMDAAIAAYPESIVVFEGKAYSGSKCDDLRMPSGVDVVHLTD